MEIIKVYNIGNKTDEIEIDNVKKKNIIKLFSQLKEMDLLKINCILDTDNEEYKESPIYGFSKNSNNKKLDCNKIASDLLNAECKQNGERNLNIREGLLFIYATTKKIYLIKLEKLEVIDHSTFEAKTELSKQNDYFKGCFFDGDVNNITVIDKNKTAAKYWVGKFLKLKVLRDDKQNTKNMISLLDNDRLFNFDAIPEEFKEEIKLFTEKYISENKKFDKSELIDCLKEQELIEKSNVENLFSKESEDIDSDFIIDEKILNKRYNVKFKVSDTVGVFSENYKEAMERGRINFDWDNDQVTIRIDKKYAQKIKDVLRIRDDR